MPNSIASLSCDEIADFEFIVERSARLPADFEIQVRQSLGPCEGSIHGAYGVLDLTYKPTGIRQSYQFGHQNPGDDGWLMLLARDLAIGLFDGKQAAVISTPGQWPEHQMC